MNSIKKFNVNRKYIDISNSKFDIIDTSLSDFEISDEDRNILVKFSDGHIKTKNFDSSKISTNIDTKTTTTSEKLPTPIILDTDWMDDVDDAVAIRVLLWAERQNLVDIVGINIDSVISTSAQSMSCFLNYEDRNQLCIGLEKEITGISSSSAYHQICIDSFPYYNYSSNDSCEDSVTFYRRALSKATQKVNIVLIGFPSSLYRLLKSTSDDYSSLNGLELVSEKVRKLYFMGGGYPSYAKENNLARNTNIATYSDYILKNFPCPICFLGFEVGKSVITGDTLSTTLGKDDLLYKCLSAYDASSGRSSWDPMTVLLACIDDPELAGYTAVTGTNTIDTNTLVNTFTNDANGTHSYVKKRHSDTYYKYLINSIIEKKAWPYRALGKQSLSII